MKIAVLAGGISPERDVSLSSGSMIANALAEKGHEVVLPLKLNRLNCSFSATLFREESV